MDDLAIIGSGPAGYTAGIYAGRANLKPVLFEGLESGGQLMLTTDVENYPGFDEGIMGPEMMQVFKKQAERFGTKILTETVNKIEKIEEGFKLTTSKDTYEFKSVIISSGASANWLGVKGEKELQGYGVSACATCDGFFFKNKNVAVIGGGNTAVEEALYLSNLCQNVTLIHRRDELRAEKILQNRLFDKNNINILWNNKVDEILGDDFGVNSLKLISTKDGSETTIKIDGIFIAIGHDPSTLVFKNKIDLDQDNYIITKSGETTTSVPGIFAAGDCVDKIYRQAVTAAGMGCMAALDAEKWLANHK